MLKHDDVSSGGGGGGNSWARVCDTCHSAACTVYCKADSAYLCSSCDARIHAANRVASRHQRVWVCQACERAPAAFNCKADAASLCATCDAEIHSANPLARRHHRVPISGCTYEAADEKDEEEAASWLLLNPLKNSESNHQHNQQNNGFGSFGGEVDEYLDLMEYGNENQMNDQLSQSVVPDQKNYGGDDSAVPAVQFGEAKNQMQRQGFQLGFDYESSQPAYSYSSSIGHSVSVSSMDISVVPDSIDISTANPRAPKGTIDLFSGPAVQVTPQLTPMDREARVLRYREKKKTRKFEKTIRYASRKAYAETRPRIKGRFAKRTDVEVDQMFSTALTTETGYGIVPSF